MSFKIIVVGLLMGAAEVVPGVSGGTIAFVSGYYERLIDGISRLTPMQLFRLPKLGLRAWWTEIDGNFLALLFGAMGVSILLLARGVSYLLEHEPVLIWSFFLGLVLSSIVVVAKSLKLRQLETPLAIGVGAALGLIVTQLIPLEASISPLVLFAGGCIAVCAWILPGLSGSFILLVLGLYTSVIDAIKLLDVVTLFWVALGCVAGLMSFSRVLSYLLSRFHNLTVSVLVGFMLGSLPRIWPWKHTTSYQIKADGGQVPVVQEPVLPATYQALTGHSPDLLLALVSLIAGIGLIVILDRFAFYHQDTNRQSETVGDDD